MKAMKLMAAAALALGVSFPAWGAHATKEEAIAMVNKAVAYVKQVGAEKAYAAFDNKDGGFKAGELYIMVYGMDGHILAHGANKKLIGRDMNETQDVDGKYYVKERLALAAKHETFWQDYKFVNPATKKIQPKQAYCQRVNKTLICSGIYKQ